MELCFMVMVPLSRAGDLCNPGAMMQQRFNLARTPRMSSPEYGPVTSMVTYSPSFNPHRGRKLPSGIPQRPVIA